MDTGHTIERSIRSVIEVIQMVTLSYLQSEQEENVDDYKLEQREINGQML